MEKKEFVGSPYDPRNFQRSADEEQKDSSSSSSGRRHSQESGPSLNSDPGPNQPSKLSKKDKEELDKLIAT
jgi:hypothetical protein